MAPTKVYGADAGRAEAGDSTTTPQLYPASAPREVMADAEEVLTAAARISFDAAEHGDCRGLDQLLPRIAQNDGAALRAWTLALGALRWSFDGARGRRPTLHEVRRLAEGSVEGPIAEILARVCAVMERAA